MWSVELCKLPRILDQILRVEWSHQRILSRAADRVKCACWKLPCSHYVEDGCGDWQRGAHGGSLV